MAYQVLQRAYLAASGRVLRLPSDYDWNWINDLPEWKVPSELHEFDCSTAFNIAIKLLACKYLPNEIQARVGKYITEYSLLNIKLGQGQHGLDAKSFLTLQSDIQVRERSIYESWKEWDARRNSDGQGSDDEVEVGVIAAEEALRYSLDEAIELLNKARTAK
ncbi:hypothetical protein NS506_03192 [Nocardia seriolae]|uniref:Uncharacterized protein n=1 Tax=Nocardia seriolae TaxID=37332 RepID=A0ABC8ASH2_9NOCA|nr:hypothetical protein [Nocardia seriolae]APA97245.1 hypothetical protein NS506_03192 [Nocardia seriolae]